MILSPTTNYHSIHCRKDTSVLVVEIAYSQITSEDQAELLRHELFEALDQYPSRKVAIDFSRVESMGSVGLRPFLSLFRKMQAGKGRILFCRLKQSLLDMVIQSKLASEGPSSLVPFELAPTVDEALARLKHHRTRVEGSAVVLALTDHQLTGDTLAEELSEELQLTVKESGLNQVIVDMSQVESLTTACIRPLLQLRNLVKAKQGRVVLCNLSVLVRESLTVTRLISSNAAAPMPFASTRDVQSALTMMSANE